ncbi:MAG: hypothetical protein ABI867_14305 [Kofleriaceae bacterium]
MSSSHVLAATTVLLAISAAPAAADYTEIAPVRPLTMADLSGLTSVGLDLQYTRWTVVPPPPAGDIDFTALTFNIAADIKLAPHWVLLGRLPLSRVSVDGDPLLDDCCEVAFGNLTVGARGLWASLFDNGMRAVAGGELSLSLPTASDGGERGISAAGAALAQLPHDPGLYAPNTTTARLTTMAQLYSRRFLVQAEAGLQLYFYDSDVPGDDSSDLGIRLALGAGIRATYTVAILVELNALLVSANDNNFAIGDDSPMSLDLGLRYNSGAAIFGARLYVPVDDGLRDLDMIGFGLDGGVRF